MHEHIEGLSKIWERLAYAVGGGITLGGFVDILDRHSWIVGLLIGLITCATNWYFKQKHLDLRRSKRA